MYPFVAGTQVNSTACGAGQATRKRQRTTREKIMITRWKPFITATLCTVALRHAWAQAPEFAILEMERENTVAYVGDLTDPFKIGTSPNMVNANLRNFMPFIGVADIVSVNGKPARGSWVARGDFIMLGS